MNATTSGDTFMYQISGMMICVIFLYVLLIKESRKNMFGTAQKQHDQLVDMLHYISQQVTEIRKDVDQLKVVKTIRKSPKVKIEDTKKIGARMRQARREANMTTVTLSAMVGYNTSSLSSYERGVRPAPEGLLERYAEIFGKSKKYFTR